MAMLLRGASRHRNGLAMRLVYVFVELEVFLEVTDFVHSVGGAGRHQGIGRSDPRN